jgi:hypothetical protein
MAKKQTRRSISVSRATYDRLKAFCETNGISMSQFVENRVGDVLSHDAPVVRVAAATAQTTPAHPPVAVKPTPIVVSPARVHPPAVLNSAAVRVEVEPPPPLIKPKGDQSAPKPAEKRPDQIFTF